MHEAAHNDNADKQKKCTLVPGTKQDKKKTVTPLP